MNLSESSFSWLLAFFTLVSSYHDPQKDSPLRISFSGLGKNELCQTSSESFSNPCWLNLNTASTNCLSIGFLVTSPLNPSWRTNSSSYFYTEKPFRRISFS